MNMSRYFRRTKYILIAICVLQSNRAIAKKDNHVQHSKEAKSDLIMDPSSQGGSEHNHHDHSRLRHIKSTNVEPRTNIANEMQGNEGDEPKKSVLIEESNIVAPSQQFCLENEEWTNCSSSSCFEDSCLDIITDPPRFKPCTKDCVHGCKCMDGYYRSAIDGRCVDELSCRLCGFGETWVDPFRFDFDSEGERSCSDLDYYQYDDYDVLETKMNVVTDKENTLKSNARGILNTSSCQCASGYFRSNEGLCIDELSCIQSCGENEIWESCASSSCWEYTCKDALMPLIERALLYGRKPCTLDCKSGCKCFPGYYRARDDDRCVSAEECRMLYQE